MVNEEHVYTGTENTLARIYLMKVKNIIGKSTHVKPKLSISQTRNGIIGIISSDGMQIALINPYSKNITIIKDKMYKCLDSYSPRIMDNMMYDMTDDLKNLGSNIEFTETKKPGN